MISALSLRLGRHLLSSFCLLIIGSHALGQVMITEFMASNDRTLTSLDGNSPDWIEVFNGGQTAVSLDAYALTNDPLAPNNWVFPDRMLGPNEYVIVYASGEDRRDAGGELHADFKLTKAGGYLALVRVSDGEVASSFNYPEQFEDISYGVAQTGNTEMVSFLDERASCTWMVPTRAISNWQAQSFNDGAWQSATTGIGYENGSGYEGLIGSNGDVGAVMRGEATSVYIRVPFQVSSKEDLIGLVLRMKYDDGFVAYLNGERVASAFAPASLSWDSAAVDQHDDGAAVAFEDFSLNGQLDQLRVGENVLAIHGLNRNTTSSDLIFMPAVQGLQQREAELGDADYLSVASPGETNGTEQGLPTGPVIFSTPGRGFTGTLAVSLSSESPAATIRYTTDGSVPSAASARYTGSLISVNASTLIRARLFESGRAPGPVSEEAYLKLAANARSFTSNLPVVVLDQLGGGPTASNGKAFTFWAIFEPGEDGGRTRLLGNYALGTRAGYKVRGSSSTGFAKKSWSIEAWDEANTNKNVSPLGMPSESDWVLSGRYTFDRALMRNPFIYELSNQIGRYAVRTRFVEVYLNTNGGDLQSSDYHGVYTLMEKISRDGDRVDVERLPEGVSTEPGITGGYMLKIDRADPGDNGFSAAGQQLRYVYPKEEDVTAAQSAWIQGFMRDFGDALNGPSFADPLLGYEPYIDVEAFIDHHLLNVLSLNADALRLSTYMFKPRGERLQMGPIWDFDRSMGSTDGRDENARSWVGGTNYFSYPWWGRLFDDENFWQRYIDRYFELREGAFSTANIHQVIDTFAADLNEAQGRNFQRWTAVRPRFGGYLGEVNHLKDWLQDRVEWMDAQFLARPRSNRAAGEVTAGTQIQLRAPGLVGGREIRYTLDGSDPRPRAEPVVFEGTTLLGESAPVRVLVPTSNIGSAWRQSASFNDSAWISGDNGVGYDDATTYNSLIDVNLEGANAMKGVNTSAYIRLKFDVTPEQLASFNVLSLQMRYDDGFVAYLNGAKIVDANAPANLTWNSSATSTNDDGAAVTFERFDLREAVDQLAVGTNLLAIHGLNSGQTSSDFLIQARVEGGVIEEGDIVVEAQTYTGPITLAESAVLTARVFDPSGGHTTNSGETPVGTGWSPPLTVRYLVGEEAASAANLAVTELMVAPRSFGDGDSDEEDYEYIEFLNLAEKPVDLAGVRLEGGVAFEFPERSVLPGGRVLVVKNRQAFVQVYGSALDAQILGEFDGQLNNGGDTLTLLAANGQPIRTITYEDGDGWPQTSKGALTVAAPGIGGEVNLPGQFELSLTRLGTPGAAERETGLSVQFNEVFTNSEPPAVDAIELINTGDVVNDIGGWWITDDLDQPSAFVVPDGTVIEPGGVIVFTEADLRSFALNSAGEDLFLLSTDAQGRLDGGLESLLVGAAPIGVSYGRVENSLGEVSVALLEDASLGSTNGKPHVGPLVMTEIMAHPSQGGVEYVEIANTGSEPVSLAGVRVNGIGFTFAEGELMPQSLLVLSALSPDAFRARFALPDGVPVFGPFDARLDNSGETLTVLAPDLVEPELLIPLDQVRYRTTTPWAEVAGNGSSLERRLLNEFGSEPLNWKASAGEGSPGLHVGLSNPNPPSPTADSWKIQYFSEQEFSDPSIAGDLADADGDGLPNMLEYALGSSPRDANLSPPLKISQVMDGEELWIQIRYQVRKELPFHEVVLEISEDLESWQGVDGQFDPANATEISAEVEEVSRVSRSSLVVAGPYLRLRVMRLAP